MDTNTRRDEIDGVVDLDKSQSWWISVTLCVPSYTLSQYSFNRVHVCLSGAGD